MLAAFIAGNFSRNLIIADYYTHTASYEKNCENKSKPQLKCHGKCQMMKRLKAEEKKDQENPERKAENKNEPVVSFHSSVIPFAVVSRSCESIKHYISYKEGVTLHRSLSVFHPPRV